MPPCLLEAHPRSFETIAPITAAETAMSKSMSFSLILSFNLTTSFLCCLPLVYIYYYTAHCAVCQYFFYKKFKVFSLKNNGFSVVASLSEKWWQITGKMMAIKNPSPVRGG